MKKITGLTIIILTLTMGLSCQSQTIQTVFVTNRQDSATEVNALKVYKLKKQTTNSDFNYSKLDDLKGDTLDRKNLMTIFEPVSGQFNYYQFIATFKGMSSLYLGEDPIIKDFHDILIVKTDQNNKIIDAFQYTLEWGEFPFDYDLYRFSAKNIKLTDNMDISRFKFLQTYNCEIGSEKEELMEKGIIKLKYNACCSNILGQESHKTARSAMQRIENAMQKHYDYIEKNGIFEDPWGRVATYFETIQKVAPQLLCNTYQYKDELLSILVDSVFKKNFHTDADVEYLLYNTTIEEYVDILNDVYRMYKQGLIDIQKLDSFLFQYDHASDLVVKNYQNEILIDFLNMLLQDEEIIKPYPIEWGSGLTSIKETILAILSGDAWNGTARGFGRKRLSEIQPPELNTLKIDCQ